MLVLPDNGMLHLESPRSVPETVDRLLQVLAARGLTVFARIDHSGAAASVGLEMPPTELLVFGSPKAGTPLMLAAPTSAIDLPLKALVWDDGEGHVRISYNTAEYLKNRHHFPENLLPNIAALPLLLAEAVR